MRTLARTLMLIGVVLTPIAARAQSANMTVTAVVDVALTGQAIRDLAFGYVTGGQSTTIATSDVAACAGCTSGKWSFLNLANGNQASRRNAAMTFTQLPAALVSPTGATLPLTWTNGAKACLTKAGVEYYCFPIYTPTQGTARLHQINGAGAPGTASEPAGGGRRNLDMYLGGIATPTAGQRAGYYTGTITLQFAYSN